VKKTEAILLEGLTRKKQGIGELKEISHNCGKTEITRKKNQKEIHISA